jgi:hypothetical protein
VLRNGSKLFSDQPYTLARSTNLDNDNTIGIVQIVVGICAILLAWSNRKPFCRWTRNIFFELYRMTPDILRLSADVTLSFIKWIIPVNHSDDNDVGLQGEDGTDINMWSTMDLEQQLQEPNIEWAEAWRLNGGKIACKEVY